MKSCPQTLLAGVMFFFIPVICISQDQRTFNQNASRSNHTRLSLSISPVYSTPSDSDRDSLLFRGSGAGVKVGADYFFGNVGIGFSSGFISVNADEARINSFLKRASLPANQVDITRARQQNMFFLLGPTVKFGHQIEFFAHAKGGVFINNSGLVSIQQRGADRVAYRNESTDKQVNAGLLAGLGIIYNTKSDLWSFGIGADYLRTKSHVNNYDVRRGGGNEGLILSQGISDIVTGVTIRYNIFSPGGRRTREIDNGNESLSARDHATGMSSGRRTYKPGKPVYGNRSILPEAENCGPVTQRITYPDGSTEEMTFSCPADALAYGRQTQKQDFGEKTYSPKAGWEISGDKIDGANGVISGRLAWAGQSGMGIVTNQSAEGKNSEGVNENASKSRQTPNTSFGSIVRLSSRDAGSGMASGKRSRDAGSGMATGKRSRDAGSGMATGKRSREAGSGMATGRRQHLAYSDEFGGSCENCPVVVTASKGVVNPLYEDKGNAGVNPMHRSGVNNAGNDDGIANADIFLVDASSGLVIAKTKSEHDGSFYFRYVPVGQYTVRVSQKLTVKKSYDISVSSATALSGDINATDNPEVKLVLSTSVENAAEGQKIKTKSNIKNDRVAGSGSTEGEVAEEGQKIKTKSNIKNDRLVGGTPGQPDTDESVVRLFKFSSGHDVNQNRNVVAPLVPGGSVLSAAMLPGEPIPGIDVKLGKKSGGALMNTETDENGEFEFDQLDAGDYELNIVQQVQVLNEFAIVVGAQTRAQDHNSSRSNKTASGIAPNPGNDSSGHQPNTTSERWKAPESIRSIIATADMDGDGNYETNVSDRINDEFTIDKDGGGQQKAGISTSRSNIRTRGQLVDKGDGLYMTYSTAIINGKSVNVQLVYKASHDMQMNSIRNLK